MNKTSEGARLLSQFLESNGLKKADAARALNVAKATVGWWTSGTNSPSALQRKRIERWAGVPADTWDSPEERAAVEAVTPFAKSIPA
jgi:transcriptional regulator with XRE-family HTH domain